MTDRFFILTNSTLTLTKKFRVIHGGYTPTQEKKGSVKTTLDGEYDITQGGVYTRHEYIIKLRDEEGDTDYGTKDELNTFFLYNNPNPPPGEPSSAIRLTTHFGEEWLVNMVADFTPTPVSVILEGENAQYNVKVIFLFLSQVVPS